MTNQEKYEDLYAKIVQWGIDRGIQKNGNARSQLIKTVEELSEGVCASLRHDKDEIKDAIGDVMVTLIQAFGILTEQKERLILIYPVGADTAFIQSIVNEWCDQFRLSCRIVSCWNRASYRARNADIRTLNRQLQTMAYNYGYDFIECLELAYNEIKDRKGYLNEDGIFVKESV